MKMQTISTLRMSHKEWLKERKKSLGGSDMGAVLGLNKYRSPYTVWAEKTGRIGEEPENEAMRQGRDLEQYVASRFEEVSRMPVRRMNYLMRRNDCPHLHANIDRKVVGLNAGLECKTASALSLKRYEGDLQNGLLEADYIVIEMAKQILGENWMPEFVAQANQGGIERVLV